MLKPIILANEQSHTKPDTQISRVPPIIIIILRLV